MECIECESSWVYAKGKIEEKRYAVGELRWWHGDKWEGVVEWVSNDGGGRGGRKMEENLFCVHYSHDTRSFSWNEKCRRITRAVFAKEEDFWVSIV